MIDQAFQLPDELLTRLTAGQTLADTLPPSPFPLFSSWLAQATEAKNSPNPNAMTLSTVEPDGAPSNRIVLCRNFDVEEGWIEFFTNYDGGKGRALAANPAAAACFHFDHAERQVRMAGTVSESPADVSDRYFASRPWESRLSAWASYQSEPLASRSELLTRVPTIMQRLGINAEAIREQGNAVHIPRPPHWGGFRLLVRRCELWLGGPGRLHDRAVWCRTLTPTLGPWSATRLNP